MAGLQTLDPKNPEALHDIGQNKGMQVGEKFVNPGTPSAPLVSTIFLHYGKLQIG